MTLSMFFLLGIEYDAIIYIESCLLLDMEKYCVKCGRKESSIIRFQELDDGIDVCKACFYIYGCYHTQNEDD